MAVADAGAGGVLRPAEAWWNVGVASFLMLATLPGRTQGLGLVTEPLMRELGIGRMTYASLNLWATLAGSLACIPAGWLLDRAGLRRTSTAVAGMLALAVAGMSMVGGGVAGLFVGILCTRALGQSALSVASIASVGKSFPRMHGWPMGVFSILMSVLFALGFVGVGELVHGAGWRAAWRAVAVGVAGVGALAWLGLREPGGGAGPGGEETSGQTLGEAARTGWFWLFAGSTGLFAMATSGVGLFNEALLVEQGYEAGLLPMFLAASTVASLAGHGACGWLMPRHGPGRLMAASWLGYGASLAGLATAREGWHLWVVAAGMGFSAGGVTVLFFSAWGHVFGRRHLGRIQGAAQALTVLGSAVGPLVFAGTRASHGGHGRVLWVLTALAGLVAVVAAMAPEPSAHRGK